MKLEKKYGLFTAISMVVGIVIGSGIFFKAQDILIYTGGNVLLGVLAWIIGGIIMVIFSATFAGYATKFEKVNGVVDYSEAIVGKKYGYMIGWFLTTIYYPAMTAVLAWVSARYTLNLFGSNDITGGLCIALALLYMVGAYSLNMLAPKISGKFQVSCTVIKLIPLIIMAIVGSIAGLFNGTTIENLKAVSSTKGSIDGIFGGICAAAFAYEGWIIATSINSEIKDSKKNLPKALIFGSLVVMLIYVAFFIGISSSASVDTIINDGATVAFTNLFGKFAGTILNVFIVISCLGTLNGLMIGNARSMYSISNRNEKTDIEMFKQVDKVTNAPHNSGAVTLLFCGIWFFFFYGANLMEKPIFGIFSFDSSELPIITVYALYIPIFICYLFKNWKNESIKIKMLNILAIIAAIFMIVCAIYAHGIKPLLASLQNGSFSFPVLFYLIVFIVIMSIGVIILIRKNKDSQNIKETE